MEQCAKRPPEKVLIMPTTSPTRPSPEESSARSPTSNTKKPARARSSLLSIISGGDRRSPSVSSSNEDPLSPTSPRQRTPSTAGQTTPTSVGLQESTTIESQRDVERPMAEDDNGPCADDGQNTTPQSSIAEDVVPESTTAENAVSQLVASKTSEPQSNLVENTTSQSISAEVFGPQPGTVEGAVSPQLVVPKQAIPPTSLSLEAAPVSEAGNTEVLAKPGGKREDNSKPVKKKPPPTLAKTFKSKPSPVSKEPSVSLIASTPEVTSPISKSFASQVSDPPQLAAATILEDVSDIPVPPEPTYHSQPMEEEPGITAEEDMTSLPLPPPVEAEFDGEGEEVTSEPSNLAVEVTESAKVAEEIPLPPPVFEDEALPPPPDEVYLSPTADSFLSDKISNMEEDVEMEFPPPPQVDFPLQPFNSADNSEIQEALDKISKKYDTPSMGVTKEQPHNNEIQDNEIQDVPVDLDNKSSLTKECNSDSNTSPTSHHLNQANPIDNDMDFPDSTDNATSSDTMDNLSVAQTAEVARPPPPLVLTATATPESDDAGPLSANVGMEEPLADVQTDRQTDSEQKDTHSMCSPLSRDNADITLGADDSIIHLISPPTLPAASSFSALDTTDPTPQSGDGGERVQNSPPTSSKAMGDNNTLTLTAHLEHTNTTSPTTSPATHSPPFNTSSESGDSGVYSIVGETIPVKLRPTTNDNRKPDNSVPMFEKHGDSNKRVTFREATNQITPAAATTRRSAADEDKIRRTGLSEDDVSQAELFYKGLKTEVMACPCLATLYFAEGSSAEKVAVDDWKFEHIGIPVLIYDTGYGKRSCGLTLVFAEKGTGFLLWRVTINYESRWEIVEPVFHRLRIPGTADKLAGIAYQDEASAESFYAYFKTCIADPERNVLNNPHNRSSKKKKEKKKSVKNKSISLLNKSAISRPCQFTHVTQLKQSVDGILALAMVPPDEDEDGSVEGAVN